MAKINIEYDTVSKECNVLHGGAELADISEISFYKYDNDKFRAELTMKSVDEENDTYSIHRMVCEKYEKQDINGKVHDYFKKLNKIEDKPPTDKKI